MSNNAQEIIDTMLGRLKNLASTETVIGDPVKIGDITVLPVIKVSVGFAAGGAEGGNRDKSSGGTGSGSGGGGGASVTPVGFITYDGTEIKFLSIGKGTFDSILESVPELLKKLSSMRSKKEKASGEEE